MSNDSPNIYPALMYRNPVAAMEWLERAFGFQKLLVVPGPNGTIVHAEMNYGPGIIMIGGVKPEMGWASPLDLPAVHQTIYMAVDDPDAHHDQAKAAGAEITHELHNTDYGSRDYGARDLEGHHWYFGTYRPKVEISSPA